MNKTYIIVPVVLLAIFMVFYFNFSKEAEIKEAARIEREALEAEQKAAEKRAAEARAKEDADRRAAERDAEEARKEAERRAKWDAVGREIAEATQKYNAEADRYAKQAAQLEMQLLELRNQKQKAAAEAFELQKQVGLAQIAKRNAEMEVQRMTEMVSRRAAESALTRPPATATASR